ncbi:amidoligase protein [Fusarium langsethiae]|uniref:Amidoligase protein n=1 Tax=Fusarium langsethiae TaxID=179993 RepID=A0A0M9F0H3_FUSLA|nr:amidoligase protein [Fusarium langsethiae]GKU01664.1 unnamed protein product [Fusarium langsethiae]GKU18063.1 unnamed protein product [Fusarium langsethiae]
MSAFDSICVGIELEFMVALQITDTSAVVAETRWTCPSSPEAYMGLVMGDYTKIKPPVIHKVCDTIANAGVAVSCDVYQPQSSDPAQLSGTSVLSLTDSSGQIRVWNKGVAADMAGSVHKTNTWFVVPEIHITKDCVSKSGKTPSDKYDWFGTELNSPILIRPEEFSQGLPTLRKCLKAVQGNMVVGLNSDCGLHLHVNDACSMKLETALRVTTLVWLLEDTLLYPLCHPFRSTSPYSARISVESKIANETGEPSVWGEGEALIQALQELMVQLSWRKKVDKSLLGAMRRLWFEPSLDSLGVALRKFDEGTEHTTTRCALVVSKYKTLEFRYPESMFDADFIAGWADLVRHLYAVAMKSQAEFHQIISRVYELVTRDQVSGWSAMMAAIGFRTDVSVWQRRLNEYQGSLSNLDKQGILPKSGVIGL